jgi:type I site-specific restriction endonuclease
MNSNYGLYAYGLVDKKPEQLDIWGIGRKGKIYPVEGREVSVMVSEIDIDAFQSQVKNLFSELAKTTELAQSGVKELLQAHEDVVDALTKATTVVPFKFGTVLKGEQAALKMLQDYEEKFKNLLAKFAGRAEWGMKVYANQQEFIKYIMQIEPELRDMEGKREKLSRGVAYLLTRKMEEELKDRATLRLSEITEAIFHGLGKDACEGKVNNTLSQKLTSKKKEMILNSAYLVEREKVASFCKQGKRLMQKYAVMGLDIEVSGPWPPYSFTY